MGMFLVFVDADMRMVSFCGEKMRTQLSYEGPALPWQGLANGLATTVATEYNQPHMALARPKRSLNLGGAGSGSACFRGVSLAGND